MTLSFGLYVTATPIGNLRDITLRALDVLKEADAIYCEDTRVTGKLLAAYDIKTPLKTYHDHNGERARPAILSAIEGGAAICLVSDAGTPLIADPGYKLVAAARKKGLPVYAIPGPSALTAALSVAGLPTDRVFFAGFAPPKSGARRTFYEDLAAIPATLVIYESAKRLVPALADLADVLGDRHACVIRELTKLFEETKTARLAELAAEYEKTGPPKGEIVIIVERRRIEETSTEDIDAALAEALQNMSVKDAAREIAAALSLPRKTVYDRALQLAGRRSEENREKVSGEPTGGRDP